jgi:hypothetical protein
VTGWQQSLEIAWLQLDLIAMGRLVADRRLVTTITRFARLDVSKERIAHVTQGKSPGICAQAHLRSPVGFFTGSEW